VISETKIKGWARSAKPGDRLPLGRGARLFCTDAGGLVWQKRYRRPHNGKENILSYGTWPTLGAKAAAELIDEDCRLLEREIDPAITRDTKRAAQGDTFEVLTEAWLPRQPYGHRHQEIVRGLFRNWITPYIGSLPVRTITPPLCLSVMRRVEAHGYHDLVRRVQQKMSEVFIFAIAEGKAEFDPTQGLEKALTPRPEVTPRAAVLEPKEIGELLRSIDQYGARDPATKAALQLLPYVFVRSGELRGMEWSEIDFDTNTWNIPAERMKMKREHVVPLAPQAVAILRRMQPLTGTGKLVFPSQRARTEPLSENTLSLALRRMGYDKSEHSVHGFRALASTRLHELKWNSDLIELQLAHKKKDKVRAAYDRAEHLEERRRMMCAWADYLDGLRASGDNAVTLSRAA
jgi:integrase